MDINAYKQIAVVGVSKDAAKYGHRIFRDLLNAGYPVKGINPKGGEVLGQKIYKDLKELGTIPDLVITVVPPQAAEAIVETCKEIGVKTLWLQPGSESDKAVRQAREYGIKTVTACFMVREGVW